MLYFLYKNQLLRNSKTFTRTRQHKYEQTAA